LTTDGLATVDPAATASYYTTSELMTAIAARTAVTVKFTTVMVQHHTVGDIIWSGSAFIESMDITAEHGVSSNLFSIFYWNMDDLTQAN